MREKQRRLSNGIQLDDNMRRQRTSGETQTACHISISQPRQISFASNQSFHLNDLITRSRSVVATILATTAADDNDDNEMKWVICITSNGESSHCISQLE